jgi:2-dehydro-3-deoxyglucarate aldolase/4-hydroxy-2-oxoheptanedioate aldolase
MRATRLKAKVLRGARSYGLFAFEFYTPGLAQIAKDAGAEFILYDMEHSGAGIDAIKQQLAYCRGLDIVPFVRVPASQYQFVARALDAGALGIMVPMVETAQQARDIVSWSRYPPSGRRGAVLGAAHDDYTGGNVAEKLTELNERCFLMLQIETEVGLAHVEEIAAVPGVDCLWIGFLDLSSFLGVPGDLEHPKYVAAVERIAAAAKAHRKVLGIAAPNAAFARQYTARGFQMISFGPETSLLHAALKQRIDGMHG